ncbi:MAG: hypothetical protein IKX49_00175 [Clostridia bacterium]|nr:hypothetical protein [Clostridia bacterium]
MLDDKEKDASFARFDMTRPPCKQSPFLMPLIWALTLPAVKSHRTHIEKTGCDGLRPPYILLCNHNAFLDFKVCTKAIFPHRANYIIAIDGFIGREWLLRHVGGVCKRKFTNDIRLIRNIRKVLENKSILVIYPEARYSLCGTDAVLPDSLGTLCRRMKVPVATLICHGHHLNSPFWNLKQRKVKGTEAEMKLLFTPEQLENATDDEINAAIRKEFEYDEFAWQKQKGIKITAPFRAEGLHKVLYQCPACGREFRMASRGDTLYCSSCGKEWQMTELGELKAKTGDTEFSHIPDWYEWERANVRREIEAGTYSFEGECHVRSLPNAKKFIYLGEGTLKHDMTGFHLKGTGEYGGFTMDIPASALYSCHIEYEYLGKYGDCVDLNTLNDTYYIYPHGENFAVTKFALATEELYDHIWKERKAKKAE